MGKVEVEKYPIFNATAMLYVVTCPICGYKCKVKPTGKDSACGHLKYIDDTDVAYFQ